MLKLLAKLLLSNKFRFYNPLHVPLKHIDLLLLHVKKKFSSKIFFEILCINYFWNSSQTIFCKLIIVLIRPHMASSWMYSLITSKILLRAFKSSEAFNHDTSTVFHISKWINKTITISLSFTPLRKKFGKSHWGDTCRQAFFSIHTTRVYLIWRHQYGWHRILRMKVIHADYVFSICMDFVVFIRLFVSIRVPKTVIHDELNRCLSVFVCKIALNWHQSISNFPFWSFLTFYTPL